MAYNNLSLGQRISEEYQLLAEEKWIIEAITKLKNQRNCLQIERLHLESLKMKARSKGNSTMASQVSEKQDPLATTSSDNNPQHEMVTSGVLSNVVQIRLEDESTCNEQELNLNITNPVFNIKQNTDFNMEQDDEEFESDEENVEIDINMLMNGTFQ